MNFFIVLEKHEQNYFYTIITNLSKNKKMMFITQIYL